MELLERNYSHSLQVYGNHTDEDEAKEIIRENLMRRLFNFVSRDLQREEVEERIVPKVRIRIIKITPTEGYNRPLFMGGLTVPQVNFEPTEGEISPVLVNKFKRVGVDMPTDTMLAHKMERFYSDHTFELDPFQVTTADVESVGSYRITETSYSDYLSDASDRTYSEKVDLDAHMEIIKSVGVKAIDKHLKDYPSVQRSRLESGINNLIKEIEDPTKKEEVRNYLLDFVDSPQKRPLMLAAANRTLATQEDKTKKGVPLWVIASVVSVLLFGAVTYYNWGKIQAARETSRDAAKQGSSRIGSFMKGLFTSEGRKISKEYINNKTLNKKSQHFLDNVDFDTRQNQLDNERSSRDMAELLKRFTNGRK